MPTLMRAPAASWSLRVRFRQTIVGLRNVIEDLDRLVAAIRLGDILDDFAVSLSM